MDNVTFPIAKNFNCDVLVLGGGCAGFSAAVCAARHGADVILADINGYLGGTATAGLVGPFMTSYDTEGNVQLIRGFFDEFVRRMEKEGGAIHPSKMGFGNSQTAYRTAGHRNCSAFDSETYKSVAEEICLENNVRLIYHLMFMKTEVEDGNIKAAYFSSKGGIYRIKAKVFIDCSGDGDMAYSSGVPMIFGDENGEVQASSLFFTVRGINKEAMDAHMFSAKNMEEKFYMNEIVSEREAGNFPLYRAKVALYESVNGEWRVNMSQIDNLDSSVPEQVTCAEIEGRKQIKDIMNFLKNNVAGCENITLVQSANNIGVRESRRMVGEYTLTLEDVSESKKFEDSVFCCSNSIDIHKKGRVDYVERKSKEPYFIPYRSLLAKGIDNLLAAGRCISAERAVLGAIRVMPPCFAMGQAAGTAAAIAVSSKKSPKNIDIASLVSTLKADGVYLP